jgi:hypothetical protein
MVVSREWFGCGVEIPDALAPPSLGMTGAPGSAIAGDDGGAWLRHRWG